MYLGEGLKNKNALNSTLSQSTIETGNKRRPILIKKGSQKFEPLPPEPPDPNSGNLFNNCTSTQDSYTLVYYLYSSLYV